MCALERERDFSFGYLTTIPEKYRGQEIGNGKVKVAPPLEGAWNLQK